MGDRRRRDDGDVSDGSGGSYEGDMELDEEFVRMVADKYGSCEKKMCTELRNGMAQAIQRLEDMEEDTGEARELRAENRTLKANLQKETRARKDLTKKYNNLDLSHQQLKEKQQGTLEELDIVKQRLIEAQQELVDARRDVNDARHKRKQRTKDKHKMGDFIEENIQLREELNRITASAEVYATTLEKMEKQQEKLVAINEELQKELEEAKDDIERLKEEEEEASKALEEEEEESAALEAKIAELERELSLARQDKEEAVREVQAEVAKRDATISEMQGNVERLQDNTALRELQKDLAERDEEIGELNALLAQSDAEKDKIRLKVQQLTDKIADLGDEWAAQAHEQTELKDLEIKKLGKELAAKTRMLQEADNRTENFAAQKRSVDEQLVALREHIDEVERAKNMHGVTARFKVMLGKIQAREQELHKARLELSNRTLDLNMLHEIARRLATEAGYPQDTELTRIYPELDIQRSIRGAVASWRARCEELEQQNEALEEERLALLVKMRDRAQLLSKGLNLKGLSVEDAAKVDRYVRSLREGRDEKPYDGRAYDLFQENKALRRQLEGKDVEIATLHTMKGARRKGRGRATAAAEDGDGLPPMGMADDGVATSQVLEGMQSMMQDMKREYMDRIEDMNKRHSEQIKKLMKSRSAAPPSPRVAPRSEMDAQVRKALEQVEGGAPSHQAMRTMQDTFAKLSADNAQLRAQVQDEQVRFEEQLAAAERLRGAEQELRSQVQALQARATKAEADAMSKARTIANLEDQIKHIHKSGRPPRGFTTPSPAQGRRRGSGSSGMRVPMSPAGKRVHKSSVASMALPGEPWVDEVNSINAQLIECLEELAKKDDELRKTESTLTSAEKNLGSMAAQQAVLYRDHIKAFDDWVARTKALQNRVEEEQLAVADLKTKADRLDKLTSVLEMSDEGALRDEIRVLTRDVAKLESEQPVLARKYNLAIQEAELARKEADHVRGDFMDMQRTYQWRILYLELWKSGAEERLNRLVGIADSWVPQYDYKRVNDQLARVYKQYNELLAAETALRSQFIEVRSAPRAKIELEAQVEMLNVEVDKAHRERAAAVSELATLREELATRAAAGQDDASLQAQLDNVTAQCAKFRSESTTLEIQHDTLQRKLAAKTKEADALKAQLDTESQRAARAEDASDAAKHERAAVVEKLDTLQAETAGALSSDQARKLQDRVAELEGMYKGVCREVHRLKEDAHIAHAQASMLSAAQKRAKDEVSQLREDLRVLSTKGDDEAIIGRLQHKYLALKNEYHTFAVEYERMREDHSAAKHREQVLQMAVDEAAAKLHKLREQTRVRELAMQRAMDEVRSQRAGGLTIEETRALSIQLIKLEKTSEAQAKELDRAAAMRKAADTRAAAKALEVQKLQEEVEDFKKAAQQQGGDFGSFIRRLAELSEALKISQLKELRQGRELASLREEKRTFDGRRRKDESRMRELDNRVVTAENQLRLRDDAHRQEVQRLKAQVAAGAGAGAGAGDAGAAHGATAGVDALDDGGMAKGAGRPARAADVSDHELRARYEAALAQMQSDTTSLREREEQIAALQRRVEEAQQASEEAREERDRLRKLAKRMRSKLRRNGIDVFEDAHEVLDQEGDSDDSLDDLDGDGDGAGASDRGRGPRSSQEMGLAARMAREKRHKLARRAKELKEENDKLRLVAQEKIDSLRAVVAKKNAVIQAYQDRLGRARADRDAERAEESVTRETLVEQAYEENKNIIRKLRLAVEQMQGAPVSLTDEGKNAQVAQEMMERQEHLQRQLVTTERELLRAQQNAALLEQALVNEKNRTGEALMAAEMARNEAAQAAAANAQGAGKKDVSGMVKTLKAHLRAKTKKLQKLEKELRELQKAYPKDQAKLAAALETKFQAELAKRAQSSGGGDGGAPPAAVMNQIEQMRARMTQMDHRLKRATLKLQEAQQKEEAARRAQQTIAGNLDRAVKRAAQHESAARTSAAALAKCQRQLDDARRQLRQLRAGQGDDAGGGGATAASLASTAAAARQSEERIKQLQRQVRMLQAQNAAYEAAAAEQRNNNNNSSSKASQRSPSRRKGGDSGAPAGLQPTEAMKKLQRKVEWSTRTLAEKNRELQVARADADSLRGDLQKAQAELKRAKERLRLASKQQDSGSGRAMSVLREVAPAHQLRMQIAELEEANSDLSARLQDEVDGKTRRLEAQVEALEGQLAAARQSEREAIDRLRAKDSLGATADTLRRSEDRFVTESSLREQLSEVRKRLADVEAELVTKQAGALELQFENTRLQADVDRLKRRVQELSSVDELLQKVPGIGSGVDDGVSSRRTRGPGTGGGGAASRRARELEGVVQELTKVAEKRRQEVDRLRKLLNGRRASAAPDSSSAARQEVEDAQAKLAAANAKVVDLERRVTLLESDLRRARNAAKKARAGRGDGVGHDGSGSGDGESKETIRRLKRALDGAEEDLANMRAELTAERRKSRTGSDAEATRSSSGTSGSPALQAEVKRLQAANSLLKQELAHFDLDFFNEIEDIKYQYAATKQQLHQHAAQCPLLQQQLRQQQGMLR